MSCIIIFTTFIYKILISLPRTDESKVVENLRIFYNSWTFSKTSIPNISDHKWNDLSFVSIIFFVKITEIFIVIWGIYSYIY